MPVRRSAVEPRLPDLSAALVALQKRALGVLAGLPADALELGETCSARPGHELALVGGPVRDAFLGRASADLDFTTSATPDETQAILARWGDAHWDIGKEFGTIGARRFAGRRSSLADDVVVEVTTYRTDEYDPTSRKPQVAFGDSLEGDLSRRDFTVNSMAVRRAGPDVRRPVRRPDRPGRRACCGPRWTRGSRSTTTRCG